MELNKNPNLIGLLVNASQKTSDDDKVSSQSDLLEGKENTPKKEARSPEDHSPVLPNISNLLKLKWFLGTPDRAGRRINNFGKVTPRSEKRKNRMNNRPYSFGERDNGTGNAKK